MTAAALTPSAEYIENGVSLAYPAPFRYLDPSNLAVARVNGGTITPLMLGADYTATAGPTDAGGTITLVTTVNGATLRVRRATPRSQGLDYVTNDSFPAESHEAALDKLTLITQEIDVASADVAGRAILFPAGEAGVTLPPKAQRGSKFLGTLADGSFGLLASQPPPAVFINDVALITPEIYGAVAFPGINNRAALQAAIDAATALGGVCRLKSGASYDCWNTAKTTTRYGFSDDGHLLVIKGSVAIVGDGIGATINRKGVDGVAGSQQVIGNFGNGPEGLWRGGGLYWSHSGSITQNTVVVLKNWKLDGGLEQGAPGPNASPMFTVNGWDDTDKPIWVQNLRSGTLFMEDMEICRFRGELLYWAGQSDLTSTDKLIANRCHFHTTDGSADNSQGGTAAFYNCKFGQAYGAAESLGRSGKKYNNCEFYEASGSTFFGGPDPDFDGVHGYSYPIRRAAAIPFTELNNCLFRDAGYVSIGLWTRGKITVIDGYLLCESSDVDVEAEMWLDKTTGLSACIIQSGSSSPTDTGGYTAPMSHARFKVNLHRTKQAADAGRRWAQIFSFQGALVANTCSFTSDFADGCDMIWGPYGSSANLYTIPKVTCKEFIESGAGQRGGGTYDNPAGNVVYSPTWPAILLYPSVAQYTVTLTDTAGHPLFFENGARFRFINGDNAGRVTIFPVGGAFLALRRPRALVNQFDYIDLVYDKTLNKFMEAEFVGQESVPVTLTYAATLNPNMGLGTDFEVTLAGAMALGTPTNFRPGQRGKIKVKQDGTGGRTISYAAPFKFAGGSAALTAAANAADVIDYWVNSAGTEIECTVAKAFG